MACAGVRAAVSRLASKLSERVFMSDVGRAEGRIIPDRQSDNQRCTQDGREACYSSDFGVTDGFGIGV